MKQTFSEQLQESLHRLEHSRQQESRLRKESDAVLDGLSGLIGAGSRDEVFSVLKATFKRLTDCDDCWMLCESEKQVIAITGELAFPVGKSFERVLSGKIVNAFDVKKIEEWPLAKGGGTEAVSAALHAPLSFPASRGMLVLTHERAVPFPPQTVELVKRLLPFAEEAAKKADQLAKVHEGELEEQRQLLRLVLDSAPVGIWLLGVDQQIKFVNTTFCAGVGITEAQFLAAEHYSDLLPEQMAKQCVASDQVCFDSKSVANSQETITCVDGKDHVFEVVKVPVFDGVGSVSGLIGISVDITERIQADVDREKLEGKLRYTQKLESLGVLAGGIAHDFNNILTSIMGHASLAEMKIEQDPFSSKGHLGNIVDASDKAANLCKQMLAYSGKGQFVLKPLDISSLVVEIVNILEVSLEKGVVLKLDLHENLPMTKADASQMQQIVMNLITNANEAIESKSGMVCVRTGVMHADGDYLMACYTQSNLVKPGRYLFVEVSDTGCGMSKETIEKMFDPFFTTKFTGRGLGMSAVQGIVRGHKGALKVYSEPAQGTTIRILLPAMEEATLLMEQKAVEGMSDKAPFPVILVVDDEETIREVTSMMLSELGVEEILTAEDGVEALECYKRDGGRVGVVMLDLTMPHMGGEETFRQLRLINPEAKVILTSGYTERDFQEKFAGKGLQGFLQKPYTIEKLKEALEAAG